MNRLLLALLVIVLPSHLCHAATLDGTWRFREHYCVTVNGQGRCGRGVEEFVFVGDTAFYDGEEIGGVTKEGRRVVLRVTAQGLAALVSGLTGVDVSGLFDDFTFTYKGRHRGNRITNGTIAVRVAFEYDGTPYRIRGRGTFTGRRTGEVPTSAVGALEVLAPRAARLPGPAEPAGMTAGGSAWGSVIAAVAGNVGPFPGP